MAKMHVNMTVNGEAVEDLAEPRTLLIHFLREQQDLTGPHIGCDTGHCGACTVDLNGKSVKSCMVFVGQANGARSPPSRASPTLTERCMRSRKRFANITVCNAAIAHPG